MLFKCQCNENIEKPRNYSNVAWQVSAIRKPKLDPELEGEKYSAKKDITGTVGRHWSSGDGIKKLRRPSQLELTNQKYQKVAKRDPENVHNVHLDQSVHAYEKTTQGWRKNHPRGLKGRVPSAHTE